jgi:C4-dicarboxylate-specific signal transduction histidine kinase
MKGRSALKRTANLKLASATIAAALSVAIFVVDTLAQLEIAVAALYTAVILLVVPIASRRALLVIAAGCCALTLVSNFLTSGEGTSSGLVNTAISLLAIAAVTYLVLKIQAAEITAYEAQAQLAQVSRVTMLGELTASIAHEVNQPVAATVMNGNACLRWLSADPPNLDEARATLERIVSDATRAGKVIARADQSRAT